ncbi:hypothetical protein [Tenacibaculum maritimum]|uniref:hypothetical protein n=1 Tax=Tenacibaculum maritimum TaxID=107401 RepID=UPI0012E610F4|nr:hypothetical protein [Tenacibaculum maritimum]MCD9583192.1 hypothetical protein [Tenacibaculum maritimum]MCD9637283.1 hypothetical protein [Tenacibaculum maritimum]CAA0259127.1 conserved hypothetical protein [Tenacibaculum maritimum]
MNKNKLILELQNLEKSCFSKILSYIKKTNCYSFSERANKHCYLYWQSSLPTKWFNELIKESFFENYLFGYFSDDRNVNEDFLRLLLNSSKKATLKKVVKLTEAFTKKKHWDSFSVFQKNSEFKQFYRELKYIQDNRNYWKSEFDKFIAYIEDIDYEDILIQTISYFEKFKRYSKKTIGNKSIIISYESVLISILNRILNLKKELNRSKKIIVKGNYDFASFKQQVEAELPSMRPAESFMDTSLIPKENISNQKKKFRELIEFMFSKYDNEYQIKKYLTGLASFELIDELDAELTTNKNYSLYRKTLERGGYDEIYFGNEITKKAKELKEIKRLATLWEKEFKLSVFTSIEYFKFLKIPLVINDKHSDSEINLENVLLFLKTFSKFFMPQGRFFMGEKMIHKRELPNEFIKLFDSDYIVSYGEVEFIDKCQEYFNWSKVEIKTIINFLTTDLSSDRRFKIDIKKRPFIKVGAQYIWLSSFFRDRRWEIILHQKIVADNSKNLVLQPAQKEKYISDSFKEVKFNSVSSHCYENNGMRGEIDVLAFKYNTLFVCELKSSYIEEDIMKTSKYETLNFNSKASEQLSKAKDYIQDNFDEIKAIEELNIDCKKESLKIVTIIISNIYQSDNLIFNNEHIKISLFELLIILKNDLYNMLVSKSEKVITNIGFDIPMGRFFGKNNNLLDIKEEDCNLWKNTKECMPSDILSAIKENKVWRHQETDEANTKENIELTEFDNSYKHLN